jgi:non-ribosomal peptide synthetase component E (peptide arylation enzyme)
MGERICACVVLRDGRSLDLEALRGWFRDAGIVRQKTPEALEIMAELPRNASGKIVKQILRERMVSPPAVGAG